MESELYLIYFLTTFYANIIKLQVRVYFRPPANYAVTYHLLLQPQFMLEFLGIHVILLNTVETS